MLTGQPVSFATMECEDPYNEREDALSNIIISDISGQKLALALDSHSVHSLCIHTFWTSQNMGISAKEMFPFLSIPDIVRLAMWTVWENSFVLIIGTSR